MTRHVAGASTSVLLHTSLFATLKNLAEFYKHGLTDRFIDLVYIIKKKKIDEYRWACYILGFAILHCWEVRV